MFVWLVPQRSPPPVSGIFELILDGPLPSEVLPLVRSLDQCLPLTVPFPFSFQSRMACASCFTYSAASMRVYVCVCVCVWPRFPPPRTIEECSSIPSLHLLLKIVDRRTMTERGSVSATFSIEALLSLSSLIAPLGRAVAPTTCANASLFPQCPAPYRSISNRIYFLMPGREKNKKKKKRQHGSPFWDLVLSI